MVAMFSDNESSEVFLKRVMKFADEIVFFISESTYSHSFSDDSVMVCSECIDVDNFGQELKLAQSVHLVSGRIFCYTFGMEKFVTLKKKRRIRKHGFFARMATHKGRLVIKRRRSKNRKRLSL